MTYLTGDMVFKSFHEFVA